MGYPVTFCGVCEGETLLKVLFTKSATKLNTLSLGHFVFQLRKGATCIVNQRKQGMWCI